jgi:hypothetical protein
MAKRKQKRKNYPALNPFANKKIRREFIDVDYVDKLTDKEKEWLNKFMDEYNGANLDFQNLKKNIHNSKKLKKDCTDRVNARNRDIYAMAKANGTLSNLDTNIEINGDNFENDLIDYLDSKGEKLEDVD